MHVQIEAYRWWIEAKRADVRIFFSYLPFPSPLFFFLFLKGGIRVNHELVILFLSCKSKPKEPKILLREITSFIRCISLLWWFGVYSWVWNNKTGWRNFLFLILGWFYHALDPYSLVKLFFDWKRSSSSKYCVLLVWVLICWNSLLTYLTWLNLTWISNFCFFWLPKNICIVWTAKWNSDVRCLWFLDMLLLDISGKLV